PMEFAYEQEAFIDNATTEHPFPVLSFFPTAEGFYDYERKEYIYQYKDHLGNVRVSYKKGTNGLAEITDQNDYYPFGMNILREEKAVFGVNSLYNHKYNGKELQESGMYDYGARFYMADLGRWGVIDPRSQYTHEAYSYVWNNPINFWDPTGMEGEDPDPKKIYGPKGGKLIEEVVVTASKPLQTNTAGLSFTHKAFAPAIPVAAYLLEAAYYALVGYAAWDIADKASDVIKNRDLSEQNDAEETASGTPDVFPDAGEETDINGVPVPVDDSGIDKPEDMSIPDAINRKGGGKNAQHANLKAKQSAGEKYEEAKKSHDSLKSKPNKTKEESKLVEKLKKQVEHWRKKAQETGENHSRNAKGNR
ncbi:RHS repeat domain-containing protein, partial [Chryseobacterium sp. SL1]|uniref:RHS repeat domain-containing protein n=1 Tax=Chryseobacterium sp. SL1 TaxID=2995159 RepID=UPI0022740DC1